MLTSNTCKTCIKEHINEKGKAVIVADSECRCRKECPDDGTSEDKREQIITELGHIWDGANVEGKCESF